MEPFKIQEPDEGYSEHPLYPSGTSGNGTSTALTGVQSHADLPAWLSTQLPSLSVLQKTRKFIQFLIPTPIPDCASPRLLRWSVGIRAHDGPLFTAPYSAFQQARQGYTY